MRPPALSRAAASFAVGAVAVVLVHQPVIGLLHAAGMVPFSPYSTAPTWPLGVPQFLSLAFWGGVWMIPIIWVLDRARAHGSLYWPAAFLLGGVPPSALTWLVIFPLRGLPMAAFPILGAILINGVWGVGAGALWRIVRPRLVH